jgi:hypothetical protein
MFERIFFVNFADLPIQKDGSREEEHSNIPTF